MGTPLLETKFYVPRWPRGLVPRPRLSDRLSRGAESRLPRVSAPAGFGKTTLPADWLAADAVDGRTLTWLSLDQSDNHPASFWTYLIAALQTAEPHSGASAISLLQSPQPPPIEAVLTLLLNELGGMSTDRERANLFVVPLDDRRRWYRYHHLFADVLRARLLDEHPEYVPELHRRASAWYERNGEPSEAIRHALVAQDFHRAADLIELVMPEL